VYYRCQTQACSTKTVREEVIESAMSEAMALLQLDDEELAYVRGWMEDAHTHQDSLREKELQHARLGLDAGRNRLNRLTDAFIDGVLDKPIFEERKAALVIEEREIRDKIHDLEAGNGLALRKLEEFLELIKNAPFLYKNANTDEKRELVRNLFSNLKVIDKNVSLEPNAGVQLLINRQQISYGAPSRGVHRTWDTILNKLLEYFSEAIKEPSSPPQHLKVAA
jgi:hypothetical protein